MVVVMMKVVRVEMVVVVYPIRMMRCALSYFYSDP